MGVSLTFPLFAWDFALWFLPTHTYSHYIIVVLNRKKVLRMVWSVVSSRAGAQWGSRKATQCVGQDPEMGPILRALQRCRPKHQATKD